MMCPVPLALEVQYERRPQRKNSPDLYGMDDEDDQEEIFITAGRISQDTAAQRQGRFCFIRLPGGAGP